MSDVNWWAVVVAAVGTFLLAGGWYAAVGDRLTAYGGTAGPERTPAWLVPFELGKGLVLATVVAGLVVQMGLDGWLEGVALGAALWIGFPVTVLASSVLHEKVPWRLAALHAGDWLVKLAFLGALIAGWR